MNTKMVKFDVHGNVSIVEMNPASEDTLGFLRKQIGCNYVDCVTAVHRDPVVDMWIDDEGMLNGSRPNYLATWAVNLLRIAHMEEHEPVLMMQMFYGDVVFAASNEHGETLGLSDKVAEKLAYLGHKMGGILNAANN